MNKVPIPESFMIFGKTYRVSFDSNLKSNHDAVGCLNYTTGKVYLSPNTIESPRCKEEIERTFFHELIHAVLYEIGSDKLSGNENLVNLISSAVHQAFKTATYPGGKRTK